MKQLEEWTGLKCNEIIFDTNIDKWDTRDRIIFNKTILKDQLIFMIEDEDGEIFGYYLNTEILNNRCFGASNIADDKSFHFNLQSKNNRLGKPMKFEIKNLKRGGVTTFQTQSPRVSHKLFFKAGDIFFCPKYFKDKSFCEQNEDRFNYHGIDKALCGKGKVSDSPKDCMTEEECFNPKSLLIIQMK